MKLFFEKSSFCILIFLLSSIFCLAQNTDSAIKTNFNDETNKTTVLLKGIELPQNKDDFSIGAFFEHSGEKLEKTPCCAGIFFTSMSRKKFKYKENHNLTIWADKEKLSFDDVNWQESAGGTAFIIAVAVFPEEIVTGMKSEIFQKIAMAKTVKMQLGSFKFTLTPEHLAGFRKLAERMTF